MAWKYECAYWGRKAKGAGSGEGRTDGGATPIMALKIKENLVRKAIALETNPADSPTAVRQAGAPSLCEPPHTCRRTSTFMLILPETTIAMNTAGVHQRELQQAQQDLPRDCIRQETCCVIGTVLDVLLKFRAFLPRLMS